MKRFWGTLGMAAAILPQLCAQPSALAARSKPATSRQKIAYLCNQLLQPRLEQVGAIHRIVVNADGETQIDAARVLADALLEVGEEYGETLQTAVTPGAPPSQQPPIRLDEATHEWFRLNSRYHWESAQFLVNAESVIRGLWFQDSDEFLYFLRVGGAEVFRRFGWDALGVSLTTGHLDVRVAKGVLALSQKTPLRRLLLSARMSDHRWSGNPRELSGCRLCEDGLTRLLASASLQESLRHLDLDAVIDRAGAEHATRLARFHHLLSLRLADNALHGRVGQIVDGMPHLRRLEIKGIRVSEQLQTKLKQLTRLRNLSIE